MSKERELLKRVRDTLRELKETHYTLYWDIQSILDQPEQEPEAWMWEDKRTGSNSWATVVSPAKPEKCEHVRNIRSLYTEPPVKSEQEPVAWIIETEIYGKLSEWVCKDKKHYMEAHDSIKEPIPLYTHPKREPLSLEELCKLYGDNVVEDIFTFARAIEKAHGIGGGG